MSLIIEKTGLKLGDGLYFEPGLGGAALTIPQAQFDNVVLGGTGSLSARATIIAAVRISFAGSGGLQR